MNYGYCGLITAAIIAGLFIWTLWPNACGLCSDNLDGAPSDFCNTHLRRYLATFHCFPSSGDLDRHRERLRSQGR